MWISVISFATLLGILYVYLKKKYNYWKERGVPFEEPTLLVGNLAPTFTSNKHIGEIYNDIYKKYEGFRYVGLYNFMHPAVLVRDPELIKDIMVKDFHHFGKTNFEVDVKLDPIMGRNPFVLSGERWKVARGQWTPNFTAGKTKQIFPFLMDQSEKFKLYLDDHLHCVEARDLLKRFTLGNVASCAFGLDARSFDKEDSDLVKISRETGDVSGFSMLKSILLTIFPKLSKFMSVRFLTKNAEKYFMNIVKETLRYRRENNVVRNDFLDNMAELKVKCTAYKFEDIDIVAQSAGFFADGVESSSLVMSYILYDIATNPEVQRKLQEKIQELDGDYSYESINALEYLDSVINESMRMHVAFSFFGRRCTEDYDLPPSTEGGNSVRITKGMSFVIPMGAIQMDEQYFTDPQIFNPERFSNENKSNIKKSTFMPFGDGPRMCLGMRFALLQIKVGLVAIFSKYSMSLNEKTITPLQFKKNGIVLAPLGGIWLDLKKIN